MILRNCSFKQMKQEINKNNLKIVVYGAGVLGAITAASLIEQYNLTDLLDSYVDRDIHRQMQGVFIDNKRFEVKGYSYLEQIKPRECAVILAVSRCTEIIRQLMQLENLNESPCYVLPMMCISNYSCIEQKQSLSLNRNPVIPKKIHYMWLGGKNIPKNLQKCIDSWSRFCPDYEIIRWDENNYDINKNLYMKEAYENGAYGFVPDYARLDILYNHGGIYLDTDVELIKSLDDLLCYDAFCGVEKWQTINFGGCSGAVKGNKMIKNFIEERAKERYLYEDGYANTNTCGYLDTMTAMKYGYIINGKTQMISDMIIFSYDYFHPYDYMSQRVQKTSNTYSIHHFNGGWMNEELKNENLKISDAYDELEKSILVNERGY